MRWTLALPLLLLAACDSAPPPEPAPSPAAKAAPGGLVSDFSKGIEARGTEPFWALKMTGNQITLTRPDRPDVVAEAPGASIRPGTASWTATTAEGATLTVTAYVSPCSDGMSDLRYPMAAEVVVASETLTGCAAKAGEMPRGER